MVIGKFDVVNHERTSVVIEKSISSEVITTESEYCGNLG